MTVRRILTWPDDRLAAMCPPVNAIDHDVHTLVGDMLDTMYAAPGRGLAAPQVGVLARVFVMDPTWKDGAPAPMVCINPDIIAQGDQTATASEGCLSIPGVDVPVDRPQTIRMLWTDLDGQAHDAELTGFAALCAQHEMDHLNGIVTLDRVDEAARADILARYEVR